MFHRNSPARARPRRARSAAQSRVVDQPLDGRGELVRIVRRDNLAGARRDLRQRAAIGDDDRHADCHRFEHRDAKAFLERRLDEADRVLIQRAPVRGIDVADVRHQAIERRTLNPVEPRPRRVGRQAGEHEPGKIAPSRGQPLVGIQQSADVLARFESAEEQHVAVRGRPLARRPGRRSGRTDRHAISGYAEMTLYFSGRELRDGDDRIGPPRMGARQRRVIAADLGPGALGV